MSATSPIPAIIIVILSMLTIRGISVFVKFAPANARYASVDSLRGFMAFFVYLHHGCIWYFLLHSGRWYFPPSNLYNHFGPSSVVFFFMITAYIFIGKLIDARSGNIDWTKLYVSRILRIMPLFIVSMLFLLLIVAILSDFRLKVSIENIFKEVFLLFSTARVDINGQPLTLLINAGVTWSLGFEWMFYFLLVYIGYFIFSIRTSAAMLAISIVAAIFYGLIIFQFYTNGTWVTLSPFLGGALAAVLSRQGRLAAYARSKIASVVILLCLAISVYYFYDFRALIPYCLFTIAFIGIACGNHLFGILNNKSAILLGQISFSIYLLHGFILFILFRYIIGFDAASELSPVQHWAIVAAGSIVLLVICTITYKHIEMPAMSKVGYVTRIIQKKIRTLSNGIKTILK